MRKKYILFAAPLLLILTAGAVATPTLLSITSTWFQPPVIYPTTTTSYPELYAKYGDRVIYNFVFPGGIRRCRQLTA